MTVRWTLGQAMAVWTLPADDGAAEDDTVQLRLSAERFLLDHTPTTPQEAALVLKVLRDNVICGTRIDRRDVRALDAVSSFLERGQSAASGPTTVSIASRT